MVCNNCGKKFDGKFCPECGTPAEEQVLDVSQESQPFVEEQILTECPNCGQERVGDGKFCVNCGFNYENNISNFTATAKEQEIKNEKKEIKINLSSAMGIIAKVYRYFLASGMLFIGLVSLLCLTAPTATESFFGMNNNWDSGFAVLADWNKNVPLDISNASRMLFLMSLATLAYGGCQMYFAIKKPYAIIKKPLYWVVDGVISLILIVLGGVVSSTASKDGANGQAGSGFAMCIVMGVFGLLLLAARIFYELKLFNWADTGLSEQEIAKSLEKKPKKARQPKEKTIESQAQTMQPQAIITPEIEAAKKRKRLLLTTDWLIALTPIIYVVGMLIVMWKTWWSSSIDRGEDEGTFFIYMTAAGVILGLVFIISLMIRLFSEVLVYKWVNPYPSKKLVAKKKLAILLTLVIVLTAVIVPSVVVSNDIFRAKKVDQVFIGDSKDYVERILGEPYEKTTYRYSYFSKNYIKLADEIKKEFGFNSLTTNIAKDDDIDFDWDDLEDELNKASELEKKLEKLTYKYIQVDFEYKNENTDSYAYYYYNNHGRYYIKNSSNYAVSSIFLDTKKSGGKEDAKKTVKSYSVVGNTTVKQGGTLQLACSVKYEDGSFYKKSVQQVCSNADQNEITWTDLYGNKFTTQISVTSINRLTSEIIDELVGGYYNRDLLKEYEISSNITSIEYETFEDCKNLSSIVIPSTVKSIEDNAFSGCSNLTIYCEAASKPSGWSNRWNYSNCPVVWDYKSSGVTSSGIKYALTNSGTVTIAGYSDSSSTLSIPSTIAGYNVTDIAENAFYNNNTLRYVTIPRSVTDIGSYSFYNCSNLQSVNITSNVSYIGCYAFCNSYRSPTIYCELDSAPSGWDYNWNSNGGYVQWGSSNQ